jgi:hypothetical protein
MFIGNLGEWHIWICLNGKSKLPQILKAHAFCLRWKSQGASMDAIHQMCPKWGYILAHIHGFQCPMALWNSSQPWQTSTSMTFTCFIFFPFLFYSCLFVHATMHFFARQWNWIMLSQALYMNFFKFITSTSYPQSNSRMPFLPMPIKNAKASYGKLGTHSHPRLFWVDV